MSKPKEGSDYQAESDEELMYEGEEEELEDEEPSKPVMKPSLPLALGNNNRDPIEPKPKVPPYQPNSNSNLVGKPSLTSPAPKPTEALKPRVTEPLPSMGKEKKSTPEEFEAHESVDQFKKSDFAGVKSIVLLN